MKKHEGSNPVKNILIVFVLFTVFICAACNKSSDSSQSSESSSPEGYAGSLSCRECHKKFYELWSTSFHGLAMQPYTKEFAQDNLIPQKESIKIKDSEYRFDVDRGVVVERSPKGKKDYWVKHVMGGKYVFFFLTLMEKGRLQVLPVSYDVRKKTWYDTTSSFVRHFVDLTDEPVDWRDPMLTFNTSCHGCHVSQLSTNYDPATDTYRTTWAEPGINCEACHGPGEEHNRIAEATPEGQPLQELKIISTKTMTPEQRDQTCVPCHTKGGPITPRFTPGERYFDHFDLVTLEHHDFYPDGRDLGENYTYTLWLMSPCVKSGKLECLHCHTSSGRYRFKNEKLNDACLPCHKKQVNSPEVHTHHKPDSQASRCIACHMPQTEFARMTRSDHSMRPPMPSATIKFKSPNACTICHKDKNPQWADTWVRKWRKRDYQKQVIHVAGLIENARNGDWSRLEEMNEYITRTDHDEIYATSLIRLLRTCNDPGKLPAVLKATNDPSPLVRAAAVETLSSMPSMETLRALIKATGDDYRLVRVRAAGGLAMYQGTIAEMQLEEKDKRTMEQAQKEFLSFLLSRPDQWMSHYNMGNYQLESGNPQAALSSYEKSLQLDSRAIPALVNMSMAYARLGRYREAEESLKKALKIEPENAAANFNLGLLLAEQGKTDEAKKALRTSLKSDPQLAPAAYNLCIILAPEKIDEALGFCRKAYELRPDEPKYGYTLAFYQYQKGESDDAVKTLNDLLKKYPGYRDAQMLLQEISNIKN